MQEHVDLRERMTGAVFPSTAELRPLVEELIERIQTCGRDYPVKVRSHISLYDRSGRFVVADCEAVCLALSPFLQMFW